MGKCLWCEKELPATDADTCTSCLFRSKEELSSSSIGDEESENIRINYDISGLGEDKNQTKKGKRAAELTRDLFLNSTKEQNPFPNQEILMKRVKVQSKNIRGKVLVVGDSLVLNFDEKGFADCLESDVPLITAYSRVRPNRIWVVREEPKAAAPAPAPKKVEKKVEAEVEVKKEDKPEAKPRATKKKAPKKSFFKKDAE